MNRNSKFSGPIHRYLQWPIISIAILVIIDAGLLIGKFEYGIMLACVTLVYGIAVILSYIYQRKNITKEMISFANDFTATQCEILDKMSIPCAITYRNHFLWVNEELKKIFGDILNEDTSIKKILPELSESISNLAIDCSKKEYLHYNEKIYRIELFKTKETESISTLSRKKDLDNTDIYYGISLFDETDLKKYKKESEDKSLVCGVIYVDNFDEIMENVDELDQSYVTALIDRRITSYIREYDGLAKKMENDKYFVVFKKNAFEKMERDNFSIIKSIKMLSEDVEEIVVTPTISIGIGTGGDTYEDSYRYARAAVEMAISRGGDQAVYKNKMEIEYYGGKTEKEGRNSRVKARVKAEALRDLLLSKESVFVMGHKLTDVDSLGAAVGISCIAKSMGKKVRIVIDEEIISVEPLMTRFRNNPNYDDELFVNSSKAVSIAGENSLVIVVDTNRPSMVECEELLNICRTVAVIDHHRRTKDSFDNITLTYIESYASSASEMVTELIRYISDEIKLIPIEADCMYAGIMIDTNNFLTKTGVRTFEAAAYLRRNGADVSRVRKIFRDDIYSYQAKAETIKRAQIYEKHFAIATFPNVNIICPTIIGARAANELLNIDEVKASFVFTKYKGKIYVSARSIDEVNVQIIMEKMGGGGHMSIAGAQLEENDVEKAIENLKKIIDEMKERGDL